MREGIYETAKDEMWVKTEWFKLHFRPETEASRHCVITDAISPLPLRKTVTEVLGDFLKYLFECASSSWTLQGRYLPLRNGKQPRILDLHLTISIVLLLCPTTPTPPLTSVGCREGALASIIGAFYGHMKFVHALHAACMHGTPISVSP
jgi:hypothetical protein